MGTMRRSRFIFPMCFLMPVPLAACTSEVLGDRTAATQMAITEGHAASPSEYPAVALMRPDSAGEMYVYCGGTLLSSTHVLTAAHCSVDSSDHLRATDNLRVVYGYANAEAAPEDDRVRVKALLPHPGYDSRLMGKDPDGGIPLHETNDIAIWELATPLPMSAIVSILSPSQVSTSLTPGRPVIIVGYGQTDGWGSPFFRPVLTQASTPYQRSSTTEFFAGGPGLPDTCSGDSGGPAYLRRPDGVLTVVGLTSRGKAPCDTGGAYTLVPAYASWIQSYVPNALFVDEVQ